MNHEELLMREDVVLDEHEHTTISYVVDEDPNVILLELVSRYAGRIFALPLRAEGALKLLDYLEHEYITLQQLVHERRSKHMMDELIGMIEVDSTMTEEQFAAMQRQLAEVQWRPCRKKSGNLYAFQTPVPLNVETVRGMVQAYPGDYILHRRRSEWLVVPSAVFAAQYEEIQEEAAS
jgi:hypothetical protein